jgi:hypothetical protein
LPQKGIQFDVLERANMYLITFKNDLRACKMLVARRK